MPARPAAPAEPTTTRPGRAPDAGRASIPGGFSQMINRAVRSGRLTKAGAAAQRLYPYLSYFAEPADDFRFQVGVATLARLTGAARPTVRNGLNALAKHGLLAVEQPATEGPDGQGIPAVCRLLVPTEGHAADVALVRGAPAPWQTPDQRAGQPVTISPKRGAPSPRRAARHKQEGKTSQTSNTRAEALAESVVLLREEGVGDAAALEFAHLDPPHVRAVILTAHAKPDVRDTAAYVVKYLRMGWQPSPKMLARARAERDAPKRAEALRLQQADRLTALDREQAEASDEAAAVDAALSGLTDADLDLLLEQTVADAGVVGRIYERGGKHHPATRAAMARLLTAAAG